MREALVGGFESTKKDRFKNKPSEMRNSEQKFKRTIGLVYGINTMKIFDTKKKQKIENKKNIL